MFEPWRFLSPSGDTCVDRMLYPKFISDNPSALLNG